MESSAKFFFVGSVLIVLTAGLLTALLWLWGGTSEYSDKYIIYFREQSLHGLREDSAVTIKGINVGVLRELAVSNNVELVKALIELLPQTPVKQDTRAIINRNLLTGIATIDLVGGSNEAAPLHTPAPDEQYPVIPEGEAPLTSLKESVPELLHRANDFMTRLNETFTPEVQRSLSAALVGSEQLVTELQSVARGFTAGIEDFKQLSQKISSAAERFQRESGRLGDSLDGTSNVLAQEVARVGKDISKAANALTQAAERYEYPEEILWGPGESSLGPGEER